MAEGVWEHLLCVSSQEKEKNKGVCPFSVAGEVIIPVIFLCCISLSRVIKAFDYPRVNIFHHLPHSILCTLDLKFERLMELELMNQLHKGY